MYIVSKQQRWDLICFLSDPKACVGLVHTSPCDPTTSQGGAPSVSPFGKYSLLVPQDEHIGVWEPGVPQFTARVPPGWGP